jgi:hypothetical protein
MIQSVDGAQSLTDLGFIERAGSKAITHERLSEAGLALATTLPVRGEAAAIKAFDDIISEHGGGVAVLKKVNSLGGKDVHFVSSHDDIRSVIAADKNSDYVMQEFLPHAKDQDIRVHMVYDRGAGTFKVENAYTRNRNSFQLTPNLANGGFPTNYILSPWEEKQAIQAARVLAQGSPTAPLHVGLDLFPRTPITATRVEQNHALQQAVREGKMSLDDAIKADQHSAVIGEAASSAGTKGTELVLGEGTNPVVDAMVREIIRARKSGVAPLTDAETAARMIRGG